MYDTKGMCICICLEVLLGILCLSWAIAGASAGHYGGGSNSSIVGVLLCGYFCI